MSVVAFIIHAVVHATPTGCQPDRRYRSSKLVARAWIYKGRKGRTLDLELQGQARLLLWLGQLKCVPEGADVDGWDSSC